MLLSSVAPKRTFLALRGWLERVRREVSAGKDAIVNTRMRVLPRLSRLKLQGNALLKLASDGFGSLRYIQSRG